MRGGGEGCPDKVFSHQHIFQTAVANASPGRSIPEFLRKPIVTCDFPGGPYHLSPSESAYVKYTAKYRVKLFKVYYRLCM